MSYKDLRRRDLWLRLRGSRLPAGSQTVGDCLLAVCDGAGASTTEVDDADLPDDANECTGDICDAGQPDHPAVSAGATCTQGGGSVCDGAGNCVACVPAEQRSCYSGAPGTDGVGGCVAGIETCDSAGVWDGVCVGEVVPEIADDCSSHARLREG